MAHPYERTQKGLRIVTTVIVEIIIAGGLAYPVWKVWFDLSNGEFNYDTFGLLSAITFGLSIAGLMLSDLLGHLCQQRYFDKHGISVTAIGEIIGTECRKVSRPSSQSGPIGLRDELYAIEEIRYNVEHREFKVSIAWKLKSGTKTGDRRTLTLRYDPNNPEYTDYSHYDWKMHAPPRWLNILGSVCAIMLFIGFAGIIVWGVHRMRVME